MPNGEMPKCFWPLLWVTTLFSLLAISVVSTAAPDDDICLVQAEAKALTNAIAAHLELEEWRLRQLKTLRSRGHASWLEVARQQTAVEILRGEQAAQVDFALLVQSLARRCRQAQTEAGIEPAARLERPPVIKLSLPGSVRLIAWLNPEHASPDVLTAYFTERRDALDLAAASKRLAESQARVSASEQRLQRLAKLPSDDQNNREGKSARLELAIARAELELAQVRQRRQQADAARIEQWEPGWATDGAESRLESALLAAASAPHVSFQASAALRDATRQVACLEVNQSGELAAARIVCEQLSDRQASLEELLHKGLASDHEVQTAQARVRTARSHVDMLRGVHLGVEAYHALLFPRSHILTVSERQASVSESRSLDIKSLSAHFLVDADAVWHLVELRREEAMSTAERIAAAATLRLREAILAKLDLIRSTSVASAASRLTDDRLLVTSVQRGNKELADARQEVDLQRARLRAAEERLVAVRLEQARFCHQVAAQLGDPVRAPAGSNALRADPSNVTRLVVLRGRQRQRLSYIESIELLRYAQACQLFSVGQFPLSFSSRGFYSYSARPWCRGSGSLPAAFRPLSFNLFRCGCSWRYTLPATALDCRTYSVRPPGYRALPSLSATSHNFPWYLPGSPTYLPGGPTKF